MSPGAACMLLGEKARSPLESLTLTMCTVCPDVVPDVVPDESLVGAEVVADPLCPYCACVPAASNAERASKFKQCILNE